MHTPEVTVSYFPGEFKCPAIGGFALTVKAEDSRCSEFEIPNSEAKNGIFASGLQIRKSRGLLDLCRG
jgi:hypothetical protein